MTNELLSSKLLILKNEAVELITNIKTEIAELTIKFLLKLLSIGCWVFIFYKGKITIKLEPSLGLLFAVIIPLCFSIIFFAIARPIPVPSYI